MRPEAGAADTDRRALDPLVWTGLHRPAWTGLHRPAWTGLHRPACNRAASAIEIL